MKQFSVKIIILMLLLLVEHIAWTDEVRFEKALEFNSQMDGGILRDRDGFLWFGTIDGFARYDGYEIKKFNLGSGYGKWITAIVEDQDGIIWFGTHDGGIISYDKKQNKFTAYKHNPNDNNSLSNNILPWTNQSLFVDKNNKLWVGTEGGGVNQFDKLTNTWTHYKHDHSNKNSLSGNNVQAIIEDIKGILWIGTAKGGLNRFDRKNRIWTHFKKKLNDLDNSLSDNNVKSILEDRDGMFWIGTARGGLNKFDRVSQLFTHYKHDPNNPNSVGSDNVHYIYEDSSDRLWLINNIGYTDSPGLTLFDKKNNQFTRHAKDAKNPFSPDSNAIADIYEDRESGILWIINKLTGIVQKYDKKTLKFKRWDTIPQYPLYLKNESITEFYEDENGILWIGTQTAGLVKFNRKTGLFSRFMADKNDQKKLPYSWISAIIEAQSGKVWIASKNVLCLFDTKTGTVIKQFKHNPDDPDSLLRSMAIRSLIQDKNNPDILWLGTHDSGLDKFNKKNELFTHYKYEPQNIKGLTHNAMRVIYDDGKGALWVPTLNGLNKLNKKTGHIKQYFHNPKDPASIFSNFLIEVNADRSGNLWIAGNGGIARFNRKTETFQNYTKADGLPDSLYTNVFEDTDANIWAGTKGLVKLNPLTKVIKIYTADDNLQPNFFLPNSYLQTIDGEIWLGGLKGLNSFFPESQDGNQYIPPVVLTSLKQGGKPVAKTIAPEKLQKVTIDWRDNFFEFQFAALNYTRPKKNQYAYMLDGIDKNWHYAKEFPFGRYSGLEGGTYILRLKGSNNDGIWNEKGSSIQITVRQPPWKTWWFFTLSASFLLIIGFVLFIQRARNIKSKNEAKLLYQEMDIAKRIQTSLLPQKTVHKDLDISAAMIPADKVGGDFYDISFDNTGNLWLGIGDVSGHGVTPGLIMMMTQTVFTTFGKSIIDLSITPSKVVATINEVLFENVQNRLNEKHFMTLTILKYLREGRFCYAGAHLDLIIHRCETDSLDIIKTYGLFMNIIPEVSEITQDNYFTLESGDTLILYTDGIPEARNRRQTGIANQYLNLNRFIDIIKKHIHKDAEGVKEGIINETFLWCDNIRDDYMTLIVIRKK